MDQMTGLYEYTCTDYMEVKSLVKLNLEKPCVGMLFDEEKDVHTIYTNYTRIEGFAIVRRSSQGHG